MDQGEQALSQQGELRGSYHYRNFWEVAESLTSFVRLGNRVQLVMDIDGVVRNSMLSIAAGRIREEMVTVLRSLKQNGVTISAFSNQPKEGWVVKYSQWLGRVLGYKTTNDAFGELGIEMHGGGANDFWKNKFKDSPEAVEQGVGWLRNQAGGSWSEAGLIFAFAGDRDTDLMFFDRVAQRAREEGFGGRVMIYKLPGMDEYGQKAIGNPSVKQKLVAKLVP